MQVPTCWTEAASLVDSLKFCKELALAHAVAAGSFGTSIARCISDERYGDLCNTEFTYSYGDDPVALGHARQAVAFYSKLADLDIGIDKKAAAFSTWLQTEIACRETNELFRMHKFCRLNFRPNDYQALREARSFIKRILGPCPSIDSLKLSFGPGATTSIKKKDACPTAKMAEPLTCSESLLASGMLPQIVRACPHWFEQHTIKTSIDEEDYLVSVHEFIIMHGKLEFVPKNAKTFRTIDKQPTINTALQRGIGKYIKKRLKRAGLDLSDQSKNRLLALKGSLDGSLATIDLSNASDTIASELVRFLVPKPWYTLLDAARVRTTTHNREDIPLEKFSSQGNGFTFPLESLIFWALTCSVTDIESVSVYGDDIICPSKDYERVVNILRIAGFVVNMTKSFSEGPFRESCGGDYFEGINIRPFYLKKLVSGEVLFSLHNHYVRTGQHEYADKVRSFVPKTIRKYGPDGYGDGHLISDTYRSTTRKSERERGWEGHYFSTYRRVPRSMLSVYPGDYITPLYLLYIKDTDDPLSYLDKAGEGIRQTKSNRPYWPLPGDDDGAYESILIYKFGVAN